MKTIRERFEEKYVVAPSGCWEWTASKNAQGYGRFVIADVSTSAHRSSYEIYIGRIPDGLCILHSCDNPSCVNPAHLRAGTHSENAQDALDRDRHSQATKQVCPKCGGAYSLNSAGKRICKPCFKEYNRKLYIKKKESILANQKAKRDADRDGYNAKEREYRKEYRAKNADRINSYHREYRKKIK